ncbi:MAG: hypothetical protein HN368_24320, partial [Spirochaetales bacterium]|nr:hypothetical protein [Spirochaetales bacterium]
MVEKEVAQWKAYLRLHGELGDEDLNELESHLRDEMENLQSGGLTEEESFIVAVRRAGQASELAGEFSKVQTKTLWKQLLIDPVSPDALKRSRKEIGLVICLAILAGLLSRVPELFGIRMLNGDSGFYSRNLSLFVIPIVGFYFMWKFPGHGTQAAIFCLLLLGVAALANVFPLYSAGDFNLLIGIHVPIVCWTAAGLVYAGKDWASADRRMDFVRFSGETFIYLVLIACGGAVLFAMAALLFTAINIDISEIIGQHLVLGGMCGASIVAVYLAGAKRNIIENMAPVLARIFSPLFLL